MNKDIESRLLNKIEQLKKEIEALRNDENIKVETLPSYQYSKITFNQLDQLVDIKQRLAKDRFKHWFSVDVDIDYKTVQFLEKLIIKEKDYIKIYNEEDLKVNFITPILNKIDFKISENIRGFYEEKITYQAKNFIFNGTVDFLVSKGFRKPKKPYFFIQEFKKGQSNAFPEPQLLAELIAAIEINQWEKIRGAYIVGAVWNFVILEKLKLGQYQYFVSENFDSSKLDDLKNIFKYLIFIKKEIRKNP